MISGISAFTTSPGSYFRTADLPLHSMSASGPHCTLPVPIPDGEHFLIKSQGSRSHQQKQTPAPKPAQAPQYLSPAAAPHKPPTEQAARASESFFPEPPAGCCAPASGSSPAARGTAPPDTGYAPALRSRQTAQ